MKYRIVASFVESAGKNKVRPHQIDQLEDNPILATMTLERFLDKFNKKCYNLKVSIESA